MNTVISLTNVHVIITYTVVSFSDSYGVGRSAASQRLVVKKCERQLISQMGYGRGKRSGWEGKRPKAV